MKFFLILVLILFILGCLFLLLPKNKNNPYASINGKVFFIDIATSSEQKAKGLSIYNSLPKNRGMIFVFNSSSYYPFWMKSMKFPIDIIYIQDSEIVDIFQNLPFPKDESETPVIVRPTKKSNYVLEINAGLSKKYNFKTGDFVKINLK